MSAQPKTPTTAKVEEVKPLGNLKPTPAVPLDFLGKINAIKRLEQINANLIRLEATKALLDAFKLEEGQTTNTQPVLLIKDSGYNGTEFKTYNIALISEVVDFIENDVKRKIDFVKNQIAEFELPKI